MSTQLDLDDVASGNPLAEKELAELRESEPKKIKRLRELVDMLRLCNDRLQASLLEWGK